MRSYGQYCSIARALDLVGDRWTLLIVRELLQRGPCRFTDLKRGLPGIATNLLSTRLTELTDAALVTSDQARYALTDDGRALEPVLRALGGWGLRYMADERPNDELQAHWLAYAAAWFTADADPSAPPAAIQVVAGDAEIVVMLGDGQVRARPGRADDPDLVIEGRPRTVMGLLTGVIDLPAATRLGIRLRGRRELLDRLG
jgi:DNA-binding HxlR family transcriptional regulator